MLGRYRHVLSRPHVARTLTSSLWARLPMGMQSIALLLFLVPHVGYGRAGLASGVAVAASGVSNIALTRGIDRLGPRPVLAVSAVGYTGSAAALAACGSSPYLLQLLLCAALGIGLPPISSVARALYTRLLDPSEVHTLFGLEATAQELVYIAGPAGVAGLAAAFGAGQAVATIGVISLTGTAVFISSPVMSRRPAEQRSARATIRGTGVFRYSVVGFAIVGAFSMVQVAVVDVVGGKQASATAGVVLAMWAIGSMLGGLAFAGSRTAVTDRALQVAVLAVAASVALDAVADSALTMGAILLIGGTTNAPCLARLYTRLGSVAPVSASTEAFGWLSAALLVGASLGESFGGLSVDAIGGRSTFLVASAVALLGAAVLLRGGPAVVGRADDTANEPDAAIDGPAPFVTSPPVVAAGEQTRSG